MRFSLGVAAAFAALAAASPVQHEKQLHERQATNTACAKVSRAVAAAPPAATPTIAAKVAWDCIQSVPLNKTAALNLLDSIQPYISWQSTLAYLKNPPAEYVEKIQQPVDVFAGLEEIRNNVDNGVWDKEYDFGFALYHLLQTTHDGHLAYVMDIVGSIFGWGRPLPLVSVSEDGKKLPSIFGYPDVLGEAMGNLGYTPSPVKTINGVDVIDWLLEYAQIGSLQDRDALWNNIFYSLGQAALGPLGTAPGTFAGGGRGRYPYPGAHTTLEFTNGTARVLENTARVYQSFEGIQTGQDLYDTYFSTPAGAESGEGRDSIIPALGGLPTADAVPVSGTPWPGYPRAVERHSLNVVGGYYIPDPEYKDIAVLAMPSFSSPDGEYQKVVEDFIADAKKAGKKKLVIDVSANGGGTILQGYDVFKQLFPNIEPLGYTRFRAQEALDIAGQAFSEYDTGYPRDPEKISDRTETIISQVFDSRNDITRTGKHFKSWDQKYGPHEHNGDEFTSVIRWDLRDPLITDSSGGIIVTGYQNRTGFEQPFAGEDVVIVYDGYCASTCTIFSEFMRQQAGVQTIAMGGRPGHAQIQAVGGVKGTNNFPWEYISQVMQTTRNLATKKELSQWEDTLEDYDSLLPFLRAGLSEPNINARDGTRKDDPSQTPVQFIYEPADCRILYTPEMTVDVTTIWKAAVDSKWRGKSHCVAGSVGGCGTIESHDAKTSVLSVNDKMSAETAAQLQDSCEVMTDLSGVDFRAAGWDGFMRPY